MGVSNPNQESPLLPHHPQPPATFYGFPVHQDPHPSYILIPPHPHHRLRGRCSSLTSSSILTLAFLILILSISIFFLFPSDPEISVARLRIDHLHVAVPPFPEISLSLSLKIKIRNRNFFSLDYRSLVVSIGYRGKRLGSATSDGGWVRARGVSYVDAELKLDGIRVIIDAFHLIEDIVKGSIPLDTVTEVDGRLHVFFLDIPFDGKIFCEVNVNPDNHTVVHQKCYPA